MRLMVELEPGSVASAGILDAWREGWGGAAEGGGIELAGAALLPALLDLRKRCYDRGLSLNVLFPDNQ